MRDTDKKVVQFPDTAGLEAEAAEWVVRFDSGDATAEDYASFQEWQNRSAHHREIAARLSRLWSDLDTMKALVEPLDGSPAVASSRMRAFWHRPRTMGLALLAASFLLVIVAVPIYNALRYSPPTIIAYETAVGAQRTVSLPDGSTVSLNTNSLVQITFSRQRRDVRLVRGEAYFEVAHDEKRPFAVFAGRGVVRDIGTAFDIRLLPKAVDVTVLRGNVELAALMQASSPGERHLGVLAAGQNAVFDRGVDRLSLVSDAAINRRLAWRQGVLVYAGEPLAQVVADFNRYTDVKVEIGDPKLRDLRVGGYFEIGKNDAFFESLKDNFGIRVQWRDDSHVQLLAGGAGQRLHPGQSAR